MSVVENSPLEEQQQSESAEYHPLSMPEVDPYSLDLADIDMNVGKLFQAGAHHEYFKRLRAEAPFTIVTVTLGRTVLVHYPVKM